MKKFTAILLVALLVIPAMFAFGASAEATNVALNKSYTVSGSGFGYENLEGEWPSTYRANLTDGTANEELTYGTTNNWFALYYSAGAAETLVNAPDGIGVITVDLGEAAESLVSAEIFVGTPEINGIGTPKSITAALSTDGTAFADVGTFSGLAKSEAGYWIKLDFDKAYTARYVRFTVEMNLEQGVFAFLNEIKVNQDASQSSEEPTPVKPEPVVVNEEITVDGKLDDNGWAEDGWVEFSKDTGIWQSATAPENTDITGKYQYRKDADNLYIAVVLNLKLNEVAGENTEANGNATNFRVWINDGVTEGATAYTHFYDAFVKGSAVVNGWINTDVKGNSKKAFDPATAAKLAENADPDDENKTIIELAIPLSEFNGTENKYSIFMAISDIVGPEGANVCLFVPAITEGTSTHIDNFPYRTFEIEKGIKAENIKELGTITVEPDPGTPTKTYEDEIKEKVGPATGDAQFEVTLTAPKNYKAGETVEVVATVNKITNQNGLASIEFEFSYDTAKFELVSEKNADGSFKLDATVPAIWENLTRPSTEEGKQVVTFTNASNAEDVIKEDGKLVFKFILKAKADATGEAGAWIVNETVKSVESDLKTAIPGNGSYVILTPEEAQQSSTESKPGTGDGSLNVIVLAIVALVAVAGVAVVIKTRR